MVFPDQNGISQACYIHRDISFWFGTLDSERKVSCEENSLEERDRGVGDVDLA